MFPNSDMYAPDMMGKDGKPVLARAMLTTEQANRLRESRTAGGQGNFSEMGENVGQAGNV
jgi:hypothetical protein